MNSIFSCFNALFLEGFVTNNDKTYHFYACLYYLTRLFIHLLILYYFKAKVKQEADKVGIQKSLNMLSKRLNHY